MAGNIVHIPSRAVAGTEIQLFPGLKGKWLVWVTNDDATNPFNVGEKGVTFGAGNDGYPVAATVEWADGKLVLDPEGIFVIATGGSAASVVVVAVRVD